MKRRLVECRARYLPANQAIDMTADAAIPTATNASAVRRIHWPARGGILNLCTAGAR